MKKMVSFLMVFVLMVSLVACGNNQKEQGEQEKKEVNSALQGEWYCTNTNMFGTTLQQYSFKNGECSFISVMLETNSTMRSAKGTYTIDAEKHTIDIQFDDLNDIHSVTYAYDSGNLALYDGTRRFTKD